MLTCDLINMLKTHNKYTKLKFNFQPFIQIKKKTQNK